MTQIVPGLLETICMTSNLTHCVDANLACELQFLVARLGGVKSGEDADASESAPTDLQAPRHPFILCR